MFYSVLLAMSMDTQREHEQYSLTIGMMMGIRVATSRLEREDMLGPKDFTEIYKCRFPPDGK